MRKVNLTVESKLKKWKAWLGLVILAGMMWLACDVFYFSKTFTPQRWREVDQTQRYKMIDSFEKQYHVVGMTKEKVEKLLGKGDAYQGSYEYIIKDDLIGGAKVYHIEYQNGRVTKAAVMWQDW